jgi:hypothetical protein
VTVFAVGSFQNSSVLFIYTERDRIQLDPPYQRLGDVWTLEKRQLLIDSILNGFDVPKFYFHKFAQPKLIHEQAYDYAIIDGKQRLSALWQFIDGDFALSEDFEFLHDPAIQAGGLNYAQLGQRYPRLKIRFDAYTLSVVTVETEDEDLIEEMFSRLNEAVPLSAAEKRNAFGGPIPPVVRRLSRHKFFTSRLPFTNRRYRHFDLCAKMLLTEHEDSVVDTKKIYLDEFVRKWRERPEGDARQLERRVKENLDFLKDVFVENDPLLRSVGNVVLFYHVARLSRKAGWIDEIARDRFAAFEEKRSENRKIAEEELSEADYRLLEFDRYVQTPNDAYATQIRLGVLLGVVFQREPPPKGRWM